MPIIASHSKVLVTGGSGFLGAWIIKELLQQKYRVRTTVRNVAKGEYLKKLFSPNEGDFEYVIVSDIVTPGAFDDALSGDVEGVIHSASPLPSNDPKADPSVNITPAIEGTLNILKSAQKVASVKRVVITSSVASVLNPSPQGYTYTEADWNHGVVKLVESQGRDAHPMMKYSASKMLAESAAWDWLKQNKVSYDVTFILPSFLFGPVISETTKDISGSNAVLLGALKNTNLEQLTPEKLKQTIDFVDVRETAEQHVKALSIPEAGNERILSTGYVWPLQDILEIIRSKPIEGIKVPAFEKQDVQVPFQYSKEKNSAILGTANRPGENTIADLLQFAVSIGWTQ